MELRQLRHAVTLARFLNFTRAAGDLNITQSALSRSIQALEATCRLQLFDRNRGRVALTQAGREFVRHAEALLRNEAALRSVVGQVAEGEGGHVTLGATPFAARILVAPVLAERVGQPHFHAEIVLGSSRQIVPMIMQETVDFGVCVGDASRERATLATLPLARVPLAIIVRHDHPLTRLATFDAHDVERFPLVRAPPYNFDDAVPATVGLVRPAVAVEDIDVLRRIVTNSDAVWVTCPFVVDDAIRGGELARLPISWLADTHVPLVAYSLGRRTLSPIASTILQQLVAVGAALPRA